MTARKPMGLKVHDAIVAQYEATIRALQNKEALIMIQHDHWKSMCESAQKAADHFHETTRQLSGLLATALAERDEYKTRYDKAAALFQKGGGQ